MTKKIIAPSTQQPQSFTFTAQNMQFVHKEIAKYPRQSSAVMALLYIAQKQNDNWIPRTAMDLIAQLLKMPRMNVYEVATFYSMYNLAPIGKYHFQICRTISCWLCKANEIIDFCISYLNISLNETTEDKLFTLSTVECLGACINSPIVQINNDYFENLTVDKVKEIIDAIREDKFTEIRDKYSYKEEHI